MRNKKNVDIMLCFVEWKMGSNSTRETRQAAIGLELKRSHSARICSHGLRIWEWSRTFHGSEPLLSVHTDPIGSSLQSITNAGRKLDMMNTIFLIQIPNYSSNVQFVCFADDRRYHSDARLDIYLIHVSRRNLEFSRVDNRMYSIFVSYSSLAYENQIYHFYDQMRLFLLTMEWFLFLLSKQI